MMQRIIFCAALLLWAALAQTAQPAHAADVVVGNGTPASCTEAAFDAALAAAQADQSGSVRFDCGAAPHTIDIYTSAVIGYDITIDGGDRITLSAQGAAPLFTRQRFFEVATGGWLTLRNIVLEGARGPVGDGWGSQGGAIVVWGTGDPQARTGLTLINTTILNSASSAWGGAIAAEAAELYIEDSLISGASAKWGGAINSANGSDVIRNSTFSNATSQDGGGALRFWNSVSSVIEDSTIAHNTTGGAGGAIENIGGVLRIDRTQITDNAATQWGGGIKNSNNPGHTGRLTFDGGWLLRNAAQANGGAIDSNGALTVTHALVSANTAALDGGGILIWGGDVLLRHLTVADNAAGRHGGGIYADAGNDGQMDVIDAEITTNSAADGGGLYLSNWFFGTQDTKLLWLVRSQIVGNTLTGASGAGGVVADAASFYFTISEVAHNQGHAIKLQNVSQAVIEENAIHSNQLEGMLIDGSWAEVGSTTISGNGGVGVRLLANSIGAMLSHVTLRGNARQLNWQGGALELRAVAIDGTGGTLDNCVGGFALEDPGVVLDSWATDATCGTAVQVSADLGLEPLAYNGGPTLNHMPLAGSVLIDRVPAERCGWFQLAGKLDQRAAPRPYGPACDVGAIEYGAQPPVPTAIRLHAALHTDSVRHNSLPLALLLLVAATAAGLRRRACDQRRQG